MNSARDDLRDAGRHARDAATSTLKAMRKALDAVIDRLDRNGHGTAEPSAAASGTQRPGETPLDNDDHVI